MRRRFLVFLLLSVAAGVLLSGCAIEYNRQLAKTNDALSAAQARGAENECPEMYNDLLGLRDAASRTYLQCNTQKGLMLLRDVADDAGELCPMVAKPAPPPPPKPAPPPPPKDTDGDGVYDNVDQCPNTPRGALVDSRGCWVLRGVHFDTDKWDIKPQYFGILDEVVRVLKRNPGLEVIVEGHTDDRASAQHNQTLSENRAKAVMDYIVGKGVASQRLGYKGFGEMNPIDTNDTEDGRAMNRRVELRPVR